MNPRKKEHKMQKNFQKRWKKVTKQICFCARRKCRTEEIFKYPSDKNRSNGITVHSPFIESKWG